MGPLGRATPAAIGCLRWPTATVRKGGRGGESQCIYVYVDPLP